VEGNIVLLIGSDKDGSQFNQAWGKAIHDSLSDHPQYDQISHLAHADLRGVPFFLKGFVRSKFPQDPDRWVLMDWKGIIAKAYDFVPKSSNVLVFAPDGVLVHHASGREPDDETVSSLLTVLRELLDEAR
jgi:predicted transcriptional regulator